MDLLMLELAYILYAFNIRGHITIVTTCGGGVPMTPYCCYSQIPVKSNIHANDLWIMNTESDTTTTCFKSQI